MKQSNWQNAVYHRYVRHLPQIALDAPAESGRTYHLAVLHKKRCGYFRHHNLDDCDCRPVLRRHVEPIRS
jgi:hypothetical protein